MGGVTWFIPWTVSDQKAPLVFPEVVRLASSGLWLCTVALGCSLVLWRWGKRGGWCWPLRFPLLLILGCVSGWGWTGQALSERLGAVVPAALEGRDLRVTGVIVGLPEVLGAGRHTVRGVRFQFQPDTVDVLGRARQTDSLAHIWPDLPRLSLNWYHRRQPEISRGDGNSLSDHDELDWQDLRPGDRWELVVRLKVPRGTANPGAVDIESWMLQRGLGGSGYVRSHPAPKKIEDATLSGVSRYRWGWVDRVRQQIRDRFLFQLQDQPQAGLLVGLAIGDQRSIDSADWRVFSRTGTTHLVSISGLHVTLLAAAFGAGVSWLWRRAPWLALRCPAQVAGLGLGWIVACAYTLLAGAGLPAIRTLVMLSIVVLALVCGRRVPVSRVLALALLAVLLLDPLAALSPGFWLSFATVALLLTILPATANRSVEERMQQAAPALDQGDSLVRRAGQRGMLWLSGWGRVQWVASWVTLPLLVLWFGQFSLVSPLANLVAIPVVTLVLVPLVLLAILFPHPAVLSLAHSIADPLMKFLEFCAGMPWAVRDFPGVPWWVGLALLLGSVLMAFPYSLPLRGCVRGCAMALILPAILYLPPGPGRGEVWVDIMDAGQGVSVLLRTRGHAMLYDAGPPVAGERIVIPYLRHEGVTQLDQFMLSHADQDHAGGALAILERFPETPVMGSLPDNHPLQIYAPLSCQSGQRWHWDGVDFEVLFPYAPDGKKDVVKRSVSGSNAQSCVLLVRSDFGRILLPGDIGQAEEKTLLPILHQSRIENNDIRNLLLLPHQGSARSSSPEFLDAFAPQWAVAAVGYRNAYGFPRQATVERLNERNIRLLRSDRDGRIQVRFHAGEPWVRTYRAERFRLWQALLSP